MDTNTGLKNMNLRKKFFVILTAIVLFAWVLFFSYSRYALSITEQEFNDKAVLLGQPWGHSHNSD